jgi:hypothetical protein
MPVFFIESTNRGAGWSKPAVEAFPAYFEQYFLTNGSLFLAPRFKPVEVKETIFWTNSAGVECGMTVNGTAFLIIRF